MYLGNMIGITDERNIVYTIGPYKNNLPQAIVFISFDPAIKLLGLESWKEICRKNNSGFDKVTNTKGGLVNSQITDVVRVY